MDVFPVTPLLEAFHGDADEPEGWLGAEDLLAVRGGRLVNVRGGGPPGWIWRPETDGPDWELWATIAAVPREGDDVLSLVAATRPGESGSVYLGLELFAAGRWRLFAGQSPGEPVDVTLAAGEHPFADGDGIGVRREGGTLSIWAKPAASDDWTCVGEAARLEGAPARDLPVHLQVALSGAPALELVGGGTVGSRALPRTRAAATSDSPVFVIGAPRSGATALAWALAEHPHLWTTDETQFLSDLFDNRAALEQSYARPDSWLRSNGVERSELLAALGRGIAGLMSDTSGGLRWVDHTPSYTLIAETLAEVFPEAVFVHLLRDGRRVVQSMLHYAPSGWNADFRTACESWAAYVNAGTRLQKQFPDRVLTVGHREVVVEPERSMRSVIAFIDEPYDNGPATFLRSKRVNSSFAYGEHTLLDEPWSEWTDEQVAIFDEVAGPLLADPRR